MLRRPAVLALALLLMVSGLVALAPSSVAAMPHSRTYASITKPTIRKGQAATIRAAVAPNQRGRTVYLQLRSGSRWMTLQHKALSKVSRTSFTVRPRYAGTKTYRVYTPRSRTRLASLSRTLTLRVVTGPRSTPPPAQQCTPGYRPCIAPGPDVDCAGGSGNGPRYVSGPISVTGSDPYGLDRDGDGVACE